MRMPKFTAELSLNKSEGQYVTTRVPSLEGVAAPASSYNLSLSHSTNGCCDPGPSGHCSGSDPDGYPCGCDRLAGVTHCVFQ